MNLSHLAVKRPVTTIICLLIVLLLGVVSIMGLPLDLFPDIELPVAAVIVTYPNTSPEEVESMITKPIEQQLATVEGLDSLMSMSLAGSSIVIVQFDMETDMNFATLDMREKIALVQGFLPDGANDPIVMKMNPNSMPIMAVYISGEMSLADLYTMVDDEIGANFERINGVASTTVVGGIEKEVAVTFQQERLAGYGLSLGTISQMLSSENINLPSGTVDKGNQEIIVRTMGEFQSVDEIAQYPLTLPTREIIHLQDIATIKEQFQDQDSISRIDKVPSIAIAITKQSGANTVNVADDVDKTLQSLRNQYPELSFTVGFDQSDFIRNAVSSVASSAIQGAILAVIVIFLFLRNLNSTLIIAISIPTSFLATFILMNVMGMSLNMITLTGLTLGVGMLVDNSVVVLENIFRINQKLGDPKEAAVMGSKEVYMAVIASTLTSVVVYLPIALSGGISGAMFKDFCFTIVFALVSSLVVSLTAVPMLSSRIMQKRVNTDYIRVGKTRYKYRLVPKFTKLINFLTERYVVGIRWALKKRKKTLAACVLIFALSISLVGIVGMELMPTSDEGSFSITAEMPYGTSLEEKDKIATQMEEYIMTIPELEHCTVSISSTSMMGGSSNTADLSVTLVDKSQRDRSTHEILKETKKAFSTIAGADITYSEGSTSSSMMGGSDMDLTLRGQELDVLNDIADDLTAQIMQIKGVVEVSSSVEEGNPEIQIRLNRTVAANYGITAYQLANGLSAALTGSTSTELKVDGDEIDINLSLTDNYHATVENMKQIMITSSTGQSVPVGQIADMTYDNSPSVINRDNQERIITLSLDVEGRDLGSVSQDVLKLANNYPYPDGYNYDTGGQQEQMMEAFGSLLLALVVSICLVYFLLAAQFESFVYPFIVMMSIPFAMSGAFLALFITGKRLSLTAFIGLIMLIGIVVNNAILLIEFITQNRETMERNEAVALAGKTRLRPILMTTVTTVVGMIPMALGLGDGGEMLSPMAVSIIGGLSASTLVTLILIPVLYTLVDDVTTKRDKKRRIKKAAIEALEEKWAEQDAALQVKGE